MTAKPILVRHNFSIFDVSSWLSALIRFFTKGYYNHSALLFVIEDKTFVLEARFGGIVVATWDEWLKHRPNKKFMIGTTHIPLNIDNFYNCWGVKYDIKSLFQQAVYITTGKWFGKNATDKVNCAEVIAWIYDMDEPHKYTPKMIETHPAFQFSSDIPVFIKFRAPI